MLLLRHLDCSHGRTVIGSGRAVTGIGGICGVFHRCVSIGPGSGHPSMTCFYVRCNVGRIIGVCSNNLNVLTNSCLGRTSSDGISVYTINFLCECNCFGRSLDVSNRRVTGCSTRGFGSLPLRHILSRGNGPIIVSMPCVGCRIRTCM